MLQILQKNLLITSKIYLLRPVVLKRLCHSPKAVPDLSSKFDNIL